MLKLMIRRLAIAAGAVGLGVGPASAIDMTLSASLPQVHFWVESFMDPFATALESETKGSIKFIRFYGGEIARAGREYDALVGGTIDVAAPMLASFSEGKFPLSDVTQLPAIGTNSPMVTKLFQKLLESKEEVKAGKTFYQYEIADKGLIAWPFAATAPFYFSTAKKKITAPSDFGGLPVRAGSPLATIIVKELGATPVLMFAGEAYEAMQRGTISGTVVSIADWQSYSYLDILRHTVTGANLGHWAAYLAMRQDKWNQLTDDQKVAWRKVASETAQKNAAAIDKQDREVMEKALAVGAEFTDIANSSSDLQRHMATAQKNAWIRWIETTEGNGHPAKMTAVVWAKMLVAEGAKLPGGVAEYLGL